MSSCICLLLLTNHKPSSFTYFHSPILSPLSLTSPLIFCRLSHTQHLPHTTSPSPSLPLPHPLSHLPPTSVTYAPTDLTRSSYRAVMMLRNIPAAAYPGLSLPSLFLPYPTLPPLPPVSRNLIRIFVFPLYPIITSLTSLHLPPSPHHLPSPLLIPISSRTRGSSGVPRRSRSWAVCPTEKLVGSTVTTNAIGR